MRPATRRQAGRACSARTGILAVYLEPAGAPEARRGGLDQDVRSPPVDRKRREYKAASAIASSAAMSPSSNDRGMTGTGTGPTVIGAEPVLLDGFESPPPDMTPLLVTVPTAS